MSTAKSWPIPAVLIAIVSVQVGATLAKHLFPVIGAEGTTALRQVFSAVILLALFQPWRGGPKTTREWQLVALYGALLGAMNLTFYMSVQRLPLGIAVALEFTGPLAVAILGSRRWIDGLWVACAIAGLLILLPFTEGATALDPVGVALALFAGVCWGAYIIIGQKVSDRVHGGKAVAIGMAVSLLITLPVGVAHAGSALLQPQILLWGLGVAILSGAIPYTLEMLALKHIPTRTFGLMMSLEPAAASLAGLILLSEWLTHWQWLAIGLVVAASAGSSLTSRRAVASDVPT